MWGGSRFGKGGHPSRSLFPGEPDRTCDTVAEFVPIDGEGPHRLLDVEVQAEPDSEMLDRCGDYAFRLRRERRYGRGTIRQKISRHQRRSEFDRPEQPFELDMRLTELDGAGIYERLFQVTMREKDAAETLAAIAADTRLLGVLPWIPLMRRGDEPDIIEEWKRLAECRSQEDHKVEAAYAIRWRWRSRIWRIWLGESHCGNKH